MESSTTTASSAALLQGGECARCGTRAFPAPIVCSNCLGEEIRPFELPREGTLYAYSVIHVAPPPREVPFGVGYVDLEGDVRVFAHLAADAGVAPGDTVRLEPADDGVPVAAALERP
ncbi:MAG: OB-fold domain-containing protein [Solirubrobacterales bacterium]